VLAHSWSGALATAYALAYPREVAGLVLLAPVTHPWRGGVGWLNELVTIPVIGPLIAHTLILPVGYFLVPSGVHSAFAPQSPPPDYVACNGAMLVLRPSEYLANAQDLVALKDFVTKQAPHYKEIQVPVAIIAGDTDSNVSTDIHARVIAAVFRAPR
jgi:pimeloyl-ACP methyl ester carboxylesterase